MPKRHVLNDFDAGWWNCFESFASEILNIFPNADSICKEILRGAGITHEEAQSWLNLKQCNNPQVKAVVIEYWHEK